ncbi:hypothetical protein [Halorubrum salinum]|uniref:DUF1102 domain-containing protein n=1 Tax=Halorubrum pallidum TaxID=1526114 RepID=A0ABD5T009_9EURY|nr:hypothetical protein [Halorubrum salinum]
MANRRSVLIGLGGLVAGGGAILSTGAFDTVEAQRTVSVQTAGDADGFLGLEAADRTDDTDSSPANASTGANQNEYVEQTDGTIQINLDGGNDGDADDGGTGLNQDAITTFRNLVTITNNGTQDIGSLTLSISPDTDDSVPSGTFQFTIDDGSTEATIDNGNEALGSNSGNGDVTSTLSPGTSIDFGMVIDLINGGVDGDLPTTDYTLTITANSQ